MTNQELAQALTAAFLEELHEHVATMNTNLLALEKSPDPTQRQAHLKNLFRAAHTIKGSAQAANIDLIQQAAHRLEDILVPIRDGQRDFTPELFALLYQSADAFEEAGMRLREQRDLSDSPLMELLPRVEQAANAATRIELAATAATADSRGRQPTVSGDTYHSSRDSGDSHVPSTAVAPTAASPLLSPQTVGLRPRLPASAAIAANTSAAIAADSSTSIAAPEPHVSKGIASVRVAAEKLDRLLAQCGELLVSRRRIESQLNDVIELRDLASE
jgi:two-component system chemotaxis sensor kinase CheA